MRGERKRRNETKIRRGAAACAAAVLLLGLAVLSLVQRVPGMLLAVDEAQAADTIVIDAGHGGFDGGAVGRSGTAEKDINLSIALQLQSLAEQDGWHVVMTRTEDISLNEEGDQRRRIRTLKTEDLRKRKQLIDETKPLLAVSIHLNSFQQDASVRGAQTFYPSRAADQNIVEESSRLAKAIQEKLIEGLNDGTKREALGKKDVLLLKDPTVPTVIVECGFLSNSNDEKNLNNPEFQKKLSEFIYEGILEYSGKERRPEIFVVDSSESPQTGL